MKEAGAMRAILGLIVLLASIAGAQVIRDSALRAELLDREKVDQEVRQVHFTDKLQRGIPLDATDAKALNDVDRGNTEWMKKIIVERGWPGITMVGPDGEEAAFLLVQHADLDTAFQSQCLKLLRKAFDSGETTGQHLALLTDRVEVAAGRPQVYGSQSLIQDGLICFRPIRDSSTVDQRRAKLGLMPLGQYKHMLDSMFTPQSAPK